MRTGVILARFQPIHVGHIELIKQAVRENEQVLIFIGSADKLNARNPIPYDIRRELVRNTLNSLYKDEPNSLGKIKVVGLSDLTDEYDNSHDWGFYLYSHVVNEMGTGEFTIYYSDGFETITTWFPGWLLRDQVSMTLLARNSCCAGISATQVRRMIRDVNTPADEIAAVVPEPVLDSLSSIRAYLNVWNPEIWGE